MDGRTSDVTHFLNSLASGFLEVIINEYNPDSLTIRCLFDLPTASEITMSSTSSSSSFPTASDTFEIVSCWQTSLATNQGLPFLSIILKGHPLKLNNATFLPAFL